MIDLSILKENPDFAKNVRLEINGADLLAFGEAIHKQATDEGKKNTVPDETYLTPAQFADTLQVSLVTLWHWDKQGITSPLRIGNAKRYRKSDLLKII